MSDAVLGLRAWKRRGLHVAFGVPRITDCLPCRNGVRRQVDLTLPVSISARLSFVCVAVSETLHQLRYEQHGLSAPVRKRTHRVGAVLCVPYAAASRADRSCTFYRQDHRRNQRRQRPEPLQFLLAPDQVPYAMGIYPADSYPEEKTHNHAKYTYAPYLVVPRLAKIVNCGGCNTVPFAACGHGDVINHPVSYCCERFQCFEY